MPADADVVADADGGYILPLLGDVDCLLIGDAIGKGDALSAIPLSSICLQVNRQSPICLQTDEASSSLNRRGSNPFIGDTASSSMPIDGPPYRR